MNTYKIVAYNFFYALGVLGNIASLLYLCGSKSKPRNKKHALMLKSLAGIDLVAVLGMCFLMNIQTCMPEIKGTHFVCCVRVVWRVFGLGSGCVVVVMAIERWCALTRPFFYQKHVTLSAVRKSILSLWIMVLILVCLPFTGFGVYYNYEKKKCVRYKEAKENIDVIYAYLYFTVVALLCITVVRCNIGVRKALTTARSRQCVKRPAILMRRISRNRDLTFNSSTAEEVAFANVMVLLCFVFILCWVPQLISIPLAQLVPDMKWFFTGADMILSFHFIVDPYFYILQKSSWMRWFCRKTPKSRDNSVKTVHELVVL